MDRFAKVTGLTAELFDADGRSAREPTGSTGVAALFRQYHFEPGLVAACACHCLQTGTGPKAAIAEAHGLMVVGTLLMLDGRIVGTAIAGYAFADLSQIAAMQRWAASVAVPVDASAGTQVTVHVPLVPAHERPEPGSSAMQAPAAALDTASPIAGARG